MKIKQNIQKRQGGGIIYTPFVPQYTTPGVQETTQKTSEDSNKITGTLQAEIVDVLKENGIPSDVDAFLGAANKFLRKAEITGEYTMSDLIRIQSLANRVQYNKSLYDATSQHLTSKGNWNEIALDNRGNIYVTDKDGNINTISPIEYYNNQDKYIVLTNNEIMGYRSNAGSFKSGILNDLAGSVSVNDVIDHVKGIILDSGTRSISGYTNSEMAQKDESLNRLLADGSRGYYKYKEEAQNGGGPTTQAVDYLYNALPSNMKQLLIAKTAAEGKNPEQYARELLVQMLTNHLDYNVSVDYDSAATASDPKYANTTTSGKTVERTLPERYVDGNGLGEHKWIQITPEGSSAHLLTLGQSAQTIMNKDGKTPLPSMTLDQVLTESLGIGGVTRKDSISFGDQLLNTTDYDKVVYDSSTPLYRVLLPYRNQGGKIVPDFEAQTKAQQLQDEIEAQGITDPGYISQLVQDYFNGEAVYDPETNSINFTKTMPFLTFGAIVSGKTVNFDTNSQYIQHLNRDEARQYKDLYNNLVKYHNPYGNGDIVNDQEKTRAGQIYMGNIFIPIDNALAGATIYNNDIAPASRYQDMTAQLETNQVIRQIGQGDKPRTNF